MHIECCLGWLHFLSRDAHKCNRRCLDSSTIGTLCLRLRVRLEQFKQLYVAHVLNHFLGRHAERVVGFVLLKISLKRLSVRVVLDLLDQFMNTRVLSLFHNRMWRTSPLACKCLSKHNRHRLVECASSPSFTTTDASCQ